MNRRTHRSESVREPVRTHRIMNNVRETLRGQLLFASSLLFEPKTSKPPTGKEQMERIERAKGTVDNWPKDYWTCKSCEKEFRLGGYDGVELNKPTAEEYDEICQCLWYQCFACAERAKLDCISDKSFQEQKLFWMFQKDEK